MDSGELKRRFGKRVQGLRDARGLTQEQLADRIGRSVDTVSNIERGINATRIEVANQIALELGVSLPDLFALDPLVERGPGPTRKSVAALLELVESCDDQTAASLLELLRVGLKLLADRSRTHSQGP